MVKHTTLHHVLDEQGTPRELLSLIYHIARSAKYIDFALRAGATGTVENSANASGETQLQLDVVSDEIIETEMRKSGYAATIISEEKREPVSAPVDEAQPHFTVAYDPLDGSSLVDANLAVGSIFAVWPGADPSGLTGRDLLASAYVLYGPRVTLTVAVAGQGVTVFELNDVGDFVLTKEGVRVAAESKYFAPGNLKATNENPRYDALVRGYMAQPRTLRYSGGMVPDLHHILAKGGGVFLYPADEQYPNGKLRLMFECAPMAQIFAEAGGLALTQAGEPVLDLPCGDVHGRTTIVIGGGGDVREAVRVLRGEAVA